MPVFFLHTSFFEGLHLDRTLARLLGRTLGRAFGPDGTALLGPMVWPSRAGEPERWEQRRKGKRHPWRLLCPRGQSDFGKRAGGWRRVKNRRPFHAVKVRSIRFSADSRPIPESLYRAGFWLHLLPVQKVEKQPGPTTGPRSAVPAKHYEKISSAVPAKQSVRSISAHKKTTGNLTIACCLRRLPSKTTNPNLNK